MDFDNFQNIGKITKLHGIEGEAIIAGKVIFTKKIEKTEWVFLLIDGLPVPFSVSYIEIRDENSAFLKLEDITSADEMKKLVGLSVLVKKEKRQKSFQLSNLPSKISGYSVNTIDNENIGFASDIVNYNGNLLLQVFKEDKEILLPVNEEVIFEINEEKKTIIVILPQGLLDLYL